MLLILARVVLLIPVVLLSTAWACAALWFDGPAPPPVAAVLALGYVGVTALVFTRLRSWSVAIGSYALLFGAVLVWWMSLAPSNDRDWSPDVARPATATFEGDLVTIHNVRNFDYRSEDEYAEHWEDRTYDLSKLTGIDMFLVYWGSPWIAHTIVSWQFSNSRPLAISIETRKEKGEQYSAIRGFFRQFELYYVVADERDVVRLRTNYRGENVYLYHLNVRKEVARKLLEDYLEEINELAHKPKWYNAATHNCTTAIRYHTTRIAAQNPWDWRILVNGHIDELGYERGTIATDLPFAELRERSNVDARAKAADQDPAFSERIREGLPALPGAGGRRAAPTLDGP